MLLKKEELVEILKSKNYKDDIIEDWYIHCSGKAFNIGHDEFGVITTINRSNCNYRNNGKPYIVHDMDFNQTFEGAIFHNNEIFLLSIGTYRPSEETYERLKNVQ